MKTKAKNLKLQIGLVIGLFIILSLVWFLSVRLEGRKPDLKISPSFSSIGKSKKLSITVSDAKSGVRNVWIGLMKDKREKVLFEKSFPSAGFFSGGTVKEEAFTLIIEPKKLGVRDGKALLRLAVYDFSWRGWWHGNRTYIEKEVMIDTRPPKVNVLSKAHYLSQGGTGLVIYRTSEPCPVSGVAVGDNFFPGSPGFFKNHEIMIAFFALGHQQGPGTRIFIQAVDAAENSTKAGFSYHIKKRRFKKDTINISDRFLNWKMPEFERDTPNVPDGELIDQFLYVNRQLREANFKKILEIGKNTEEVLNWDGAFLRLPNSKRMAGFADHRAYRYKGKLIDRQIHLGIDLASLVHSPVPAANSGKVVFADELGIYGQTVIIDHGFGLFSMYSHLSRMNIQKGAKVSKGDIIGQTGRTGLAGGDHLHFSIFVHNTFV
ncbi:MAG: M23 family metallopeptidase, partial [Desulfobacterales bacterium]